MYKIVNIKDGLNLAGVSADKTDECHCDICIEFLNLANNLAKKNCNTNLVIDTGTWHIVGVVPKGLNSTLNS